MKIRPQKKHLLDCDRCGVILRNMPAVLNLERPINQDKDLVSHDNYRFKLCPRCARKLFGWMGTAKEVTP